MNRILSLLVELLGITLFAIGALATLGFISAETSVDAIRRGLAEMECESGAGFLTTVHILAGTRLALIRGFLFSPFLLCSLVEQFMLGVKNVVSLESGQKFQPCQYGPLPVDPELRAVC